MISSGPYDADPVMPRLLAGGPDSLRLPRGAAIVLAALAVVVSFIEPAVGADPFGMWPFDLRTAAFAACAAIITAALAARWLGAAIGFAAGVVQLSTLYALGLSLGGGWVDWFLCLLATIAMGIFARANVCGRMPTLASSHVSTVFYAAVGLMLVQFGGWEAAGILIACITYLLLNQDGRGFRFLAQLLGLGILALFIGLTILVAQFPAEACPKAQGGWQSLAGVAVGMLPWTPFGAMAVVIGCWRGHYATGFWQFVACWWFVPLLLMAGDLIGARAALAITSPALAIFAAAGLWEVLAWWRKKNRRPSTAG